MAVDPARAKSLFLAASDMSPEERAAYLDRECGEDAELRDRVEALLRAEDAAPMPPDRGEATVTHATEGPPTTQDYADPTARVGTVVAGRYKLMEEIGAGGMGSVFMALQTEPVKRAVAVKVIKAGMDSAAVLARFEAERQALAMMDHPNIAKVLDAGATDEGRPFFVMELVKGVPITEYCDERRLTPRQRLELFVPVCQAIQHAHQKGIIHRDIKPSNVLVAMYDDRPVPKVIDFGVAKAAGSILTEKTLMTGFGAVVGTPEYMSPEQASLNNLDIDTRSDVYSLGVLLYELLTGTTPVDRRSLGAAAVLEILRIVREVEAPWPSFKLSSSDTLPSIAANRGTEPARLSRLMKGELDWLVLKALEKDRTRRYETANALSRDIQRYLADELVEARPPSAGYRLKKFVRRHKGKVIAASLVVIALLAGVIGTTIGLIRAEEARADESAARQKEEEERKFAQAIAEFVKDDFLALTSVEGQNRFGGEGLDRNATLLDLLNRAADKLKARKDLDPLIEAELCWIIGVSYRGAGEAGKGVPFLERSRDLRRTVLGPEHESTLHAANSLARAYHNAGRMRQALELLEQIREPYVRTLGPDHASTLGMLGNLAAVYGDLGRLSESIELHEHVHDASLKTLGADHEDTIRALHNLAVSNLADGKLRHAIELFEQVRDANLKTVGADHPNTLLTLNNLAGAYQEAGRLPEAIDLLRQVHEGSVKTLGPDHADTLNVLNQLAGAYVAAKKLPEAIELFEEIRDTQLKKLEADDPAVLTVLNNLAMANKDAGRLPQAIELFEQARDAMVKKLGADDPATLTTLNNLGMAYQAAGQLDKALPVFEETLKLREANLDPGHPDTHESMAILAEGYWETGQVDKALPLFEESLRLQKGKRDPDHPRIIITTAHLAAHYWKVGRLDRSIPLFEELLPLLEQAHGRQHPDTLSTVANLGINYKDAGRIDEALPLLEEAFAAGSQHSEMSWVASPLLDALTKAEQVEKGLPLFEGTLRLQTAKFGRDHPDTVATMGTLAAAYWLLGRLDHSIPLFEETLKFLEKKPGRLHPDTLMIVANLGVNYKDAGRVAEAIPLLENAYKASKLFPTLHFVGRQLLDAYVKAGKPTEASKLIDELLADARKELPKESPDLAGLLANLGSVLLDLKQFAEAEPLLRECLAIRDNKLPDNWLTFNTMSMLGETLLGKQKYDEAGPLLLKGYEGMKAREKSIPQSGGGELRIPQALDRLIELSTAMEKPDEVKKWRAERAKYPAVE